MANDVSYFVALFAGILSFFSPCILPLIPAYIMYIAGISVEGEEKSKMGVVITRTLAFIAGFTVVFLIMGASASAIGRLFIRNREIITQISAVIIVIFGLQLLGVLKIGYLGKVVKPRGPKSTGSVLSSFLMGVAFSAGWTPCFGPVLASILFYAGTSATINKGILLLGVYSIGMGIPFLLTAVFLSKATKLLGRVEKHGELITKISGAILVIFGLLMFFNKIVDISRFLLQYING